MTPDQRLLLIGGYISSALYLSGIFVASLVYGNGAYKLALLSAGVSCISYAVQLTGVSRELSFGIAALSWMFGIVGGLVTIFIGA